jgi:hypothetical protein
LNCFYAGWDKMLIKLVGGRAPNFSGLAAYSKAGPLLRLMSAFRPTGAKAMERVEVDPTSKICKRLITSTCESRPQSNHHLLPPIRMVPDSKENMDVPVMEWNLDLDPR